MEYLVYRIEGKNLLPICRQMWYELGNIYREMMDIKYRIYVCSKKEITKFGGKTINKYSADSILYFTKFIKSYNSYVKSLSLSIYILSLFSLLHFPLIISLIATLGFRKAWRKYKRNRFCCLICNWQNATTNKSRITRTPSVRT